MLTVCIIVKDDAENLEKCLSCIHKMGYDIVVIDTGSRDESKAVASKYTKNVYDYKWSDDFAAARNYALSKATGEYVMFLDSDEFIEDMRPQELKLLEVQLQEHGDSVGRIRRHNVLTQNGEKTENVEWINRIFSKELYCYEGSIHEQVVALDGKCYDTYLTPINIVHTGYDLSPERKKEKAYRNIRLLEKELMFLEKNDEIDKIPYVLYQLGKGYFMAKEAEKACDYFARALSYELEPKLEYVIDMVECYGYSLIDADRAYEALGLESVYEAFCDSADFQFMMGLVYMNNSMFDRAVEEFYKATRHSECKNSGVNSYAAFYNIGVVYECLGNIPEAVEAYKKCGDYEKAVKRLYAIIEIS